jgi:hypothetical protein
MPCRLPVAEAGAVVAAATEPPVVEHDTLHPDAGGAIDEVEQPGKLMVEVHGLPGIENERLGSEPSAAGSHERVKTVGDAVEPHGRPGKEDPRAFVGLSRREPNLPRSHELTSTEDSRGGARALRQAFDEPVLVTAPGDVHGPDLAMPCPECGRSDGHDIGGIDPWFAPPKFAPVQAVSHRSPLRTPLAAPFAGEIEDLGRACGHGHLDDQGSEVVEGCIARGSRAH